MLQNMRFYRLILWFCIIVVGIIDASEIQKTSTAKALEVAFKNAFGEKSGVSVIRHYENMAYLYAQQLKCPVPLINNAIKKIEDDNDNYNDLVNFYLEDLKLLKDRDDQTSSYLTVIPDVSPLYKMLQQQCAEQMEKKVDFSELEDTIGHPMYGAIFSTSQYPDIMLLTFSIFSKDAEPQDYKNLEQDLRKYRQDPAAKQMNCSNFYKIHRFFLDIFTKVTLKEKYNQMQVSSQASYAAYMKDFLQEQDSDFLSKFFCLPETEQNANRMSIADYIVKYVPSYLKDGRLLKRIEQSKVKIISESSIRQGKEQEEASARAVIHKQFLTDIQNVEQRQKHAKQFITKMQSRMATVQDVCDQKLLQSQDQKKNFFINSFFAYQQLQLKSAQQQEEIVRDVIIQEQQQELQQFFTGNEYEELKEDYVQYSYDQIERIFQGYEKLFKNLKKYEQRSCKSVRKDEEKKRKEQEVIVRMIQLNHANRQHVEQRQGSRVVQVTSHDPYATAVGQQYPSDTSEQEEQFSLEEQPVRQQLNQDGMYRHNPYWFSQT